MFKGKGLLQQIADELSDRKVLRSLGLDFPRYRAAKAEIQRVSNFEGFRNEPPTDIEIGLGFFAFVLWTLKGMELKDPAFGQAANETARIVSVNFISALTNAPEIVASIQRRVANFDPDYEVALALAKDSSPAWKGSLTRAVIMVCRSIAYEATGLMGGKLDLPGDMRIKEMGLVAYCMLVSALDESTAAKIVAPLGILE